MCNLLIFREHFSGKTANIDISGKPRYEYYFSKKQKDEQCRCVEIVEDGLEHLIQLSYFIGVDWISPNQAIYVEPKLNKVVAGNDGAAIDQYQQTDYLQMLINALKHPDIATHVSDLYEIKVDEPLIQINQQQDLLTPLLIIHFLGLVKEIVRKGLKKSYYKTTENLTGKIKGKVLVGQTIKQNLLKNKTLNAYCAFDEFGINGLENRLIKRTLVFIQRYISVTRIPNATVYINDLYNYIMPAFASVSEEVSLNDVKQTKKNVFYKEYEPVINLSKLILRRFGYNVNTVANEDTVSTPPFWIDMSKLFELYVLSKLKDQFHSNVKYHFTARWNELDFLLNDSKNKMVIDAKYKPIYQRHYDINDIRQISGYARLEQVYADLEISEEKNIDCLVIYPDQTASLSLSSDLKLTPIKGFVNFYKTPVALPTLK